VRESSVRGTVGVLRKRGASEETGKNLARSAGSVSQAKKSYTMSPIKIFSSYILGQWSFNTTESRAWRNDTYHGRNDAQKPALNFKNPQIGATKNAGEIDDGCSHIVSGNIIERMSNSRIA
jgi:hypothetical protein